MHVPAAKKHPGNFVCPEIAIPSSIHSSMQFDEPILAQLYGMYWASRRNTARSLVLFLAFAFEMCMLNAGRG